MYIDSLITASNSFDVRQSSLIGHFARTKSAEPMSKEDRIGRETIQIRREVRMTQPKVPDESYNVRNKLH